MICCVAQAVFFGGVELVGAARIKMMPTKIDSPDFTKYGSWFSGDMFKSGTLQADLEVSDDQCAWSEGKGCVDPTGNSDHCEYGMKKRGAKRSWWKPSFLSTKCYSAFGKDDCCLAKRANRPDGVVSAEFVMAAMKVLQQALLLEETTTNFFMSRRLLRLVKSIEVLRQMTDSSENQHVLSATTRLFLSNTTLLSDWLNFSVDRGFWTQVAEHHNSQFPDHQVEKDVVDSLIATNVGIQAKLNKDWVVDGVDDSPMAWVSAIIGKTVKKLMDTMDMTQEQRAQIRANINDVQSEPSSNPGESMKGLEESTELAEAALDDVDDALEDAHLQEENSSLIEMDPWTKVFYLEAGAAAVVLFFTAIFNILKFIVMLPYNLATGAYYALRTLWIVVPVIARNAEF